MPNITFSGLVNGAADYLKSSSLIWKAIINPLVISIILTILIIIILNSINNSDISQKKKTWRSWIYIFATTLIILFAHHHALTKIIEENSSHQDVRAVFAGIDGSKTLSPIESVPVIPAIYTNKVEGSADDITPITLPATSCPFSRLACGT